MLRRRSLILLLAASCIVEVSPGQSIDPPATRVLEVGATQTATLHQPEVVHSWKVNSEKADQALTVEIDQLGIDLKARIVDPVGGARLDGSTGPTGKELFRWIADIPGAWEVQVYALDPAITGSYRITWTSEQTAAEEDRTLAQITEQAVEAEGAREREEFEMAEQLLNQLLESQRAVFPEDNVETACTLSNLAEVYAELGKFDSAEPLMRQAVSILEQQAAGSLPLARALANLSVLRSFQGYPQEGEAPLQRALQIRRSILGFDSLEVATTLQHLAALDGRLGRFDRADELLNQSLAITENLLGKDHPRVADLLVHLGTHYRRTNEIREAEAAHRRARAIREAEYGPRHLSVAESLESLAIIHSDRGEFAEAEALHRQALEIRTEKLGEEHPLVASALANVGVTLFERGRVSEAEETLRRVLELRERIHGPGHPTVAATLTNLGLLLIRGRAAYREAEALLSRALSIWEERLGPNHPDLARPLDSLAELYTLLGRNRQAEPLLERAVRIRQETLGPEHPLLARSLTSLAQLYGALGDYSRQEALYRRVLALVQEVRGLEHPDTATALNNLATNLANSGQTEAAIELVEQALAIRKKIHPPDHPNLAFSLASLATLLRDQKKYAEGEPLYERAASILEAAYGPEDPRLASLLNNLANLRWLDGRHEESKPLFERALAIREQKLGRDHFLVALTLRHQASMLFDQTRENWEECLQLLDRAIEILDAQLFSPQARIRALIERARVRKFVAQTALAIEDLKEALQSLEELRPRLGGTEETRAKQLEQFRTSYFRMVSWQIEAGNVEAAFDYADRGKARALLDQLAAGKIDLRSSIPQDVREELEAKEAEALGLLAELQERITRLRDRPELSDEERGRRIRPLNEQLRAAQDTYKEVYREIKSNSPLWRDLITVGGSPVPLRTAQRHLVPDRGLLLCYLLGEEQSYVFLIPPVGAQPRVVPLDVPADLATAFELPEGEVGSPGLERMVFGGRATRSFQVRQLGQFPLLAHALFQILIPASIRESVLGAREIVVVPDGFLHSIPFESLVLEASDANGPETVYWLDRGPIVRYAPSATTLFNLENRPANRLVPGGAPTLLSLSDPIYRPSELASQEAASQLSTLDESEKPGTRSTYERMGGPLRRLPGTARESEAIINAFSDTLGLSPNSVLWLRGAEATEENLRRGLPAKRYVHLATHGLVGDSNQSLFSSLALTPPREGFSSDNDGFLQLFEIYDLRVPECELAVLSACETNVGTLIGREGVFALSRGFLAAGARRVLASQWAVDDESTAVLMSQFFLQIARQSQAGTPIDYPGALRDAKRVLRSSPEYADPYYWAPFILIGKR